MDSLIQITKRDDISNVKKYNAYREIVESSYTPDKKLFYSKKILELGKLNKKKKWQATAHIFMGHALKLKGDLSEAIEMYLKGVGIYEEVGDEIGIGSAFVNIGDVYNVQGNFDNSKSYYHDAVDIFTRKNDSVRLATTLLNLGEVFRKQTIYDSSLYFFNKSLPIFRTLNHRIGVAYSQGNIGLVYTEQNKNDSAEYYLNQAIGTLKELGDRYPVAVYQTYIADIYKDRGDIPAALEYAHQSLQIAQEEGLKEQIRDASNKLAELYNDQKDYENAFKYQSQYIAYRDSINNEETIRKMADLRTEYEVSKKQAEVELLSEKQRTQQIINISLSIVLLLVAIIAFIWYQNSQSRKRINKILSEQKEEIEAQRDKLEEMVKMKDRFFGIISHDLRSPVNSLQGLSKLMRHYLDSNQYDELKSFVPMVDQSINNLSSLVDNLLSWAMSQQGELPYYPQRIKIYYTIEEVRKIFENLAQAKNIDLECNVSKDLEVWADRDGLFALLRNLVNNAIKFTPENGKIQIVAQANNHYSCIKISDTGYGIPPEKINELFKFDKNKSTKGTAGEKGSGLGLALCKELAQINNGTIEVQSELRKGTTFTVTLPLPEES